MRSPRVHHVTLEVEGIATAPASKRVVYMNDRLEGFYRQIIEGVGEDPHREGLEKTPERAAKAMQYLTRGYQQSVDEVVNNAIFESDNDQMILVKDIELYSLCEHHLLPFIGKCHVAYIPTGKVIGLSKIARIVDMYARRLQIQENLTKQIADTLMDAIEPAGVGVIIEAQHLCMMMRGVEKQNSKMTTSMMLGTFLNHDRTRSEFLRLVRD
jgi:GTP cyclohydrolase I